MTYTTVTDGVDSVLATHHNELVTGLTAAEGDIATLQSDMTTAQADIAALEDTMGDTITSSATPTINTDVTRRFSITALAVDITSFTTNLSGTPAEWQTLWIVITPTATRSITWGTSFENGSSSLPTTCSATIDIGFRWNPITSKWRCMASG